MKTAKATLESASPYGQSKYYEVPKLERETDDAREARTWRNRMHVDDHGRMFIPAMAFKNCLSATAKFLGKQVPGRGKKTYTKSFESGIIAPEPMTLDIIAADVPGLWLHVPSDGVRGSGKRVKKCFPVIPKWNGVISFFILDELITKEVFLEHLEAAGKFKGIGFFRPENNGYYGRFNVVNLEWS